MAADLYRAALAVDRGHPEANHNLAILMLQSGDLEGPLNHFRTALERDGERELYWLSYGRALLLAGRPGEAAAVLEEGQADVANSIVFDDLLAHAHSLPSEPLDRERIATSLTSLGERQSEALAERGDIDGAVARLGRVISRRPAEAGRLLIQLSSLLAKSGATEPAIDACRAAIARNPHFAEAHYQLGSILSETNRVAEGFAHFIRRAELVHSAGGPAVPSEAAHKIKDDAQQLEYLRTNRLIADDGGLSFHLGNGERLSGPAVNSASAPADLETRWRSAAPRLLVIDNFLNSEALDRLRSYCAKSTVWKRVYESGYLGATPADGFACPLLAQIVEEIEEVYGSILSPHRFRYLGAFRYDSILSSGTNTHADFSAINVNLYITPDEANLDPRTGGMVIWDKGALSEAELRRLNGDELSLRKMLESNNVKTTRVPHRANRAVIFESNLFHKTDTCRFQEGYLNKRVNVSFLYGDWNAQ